MSNLDTSKSEKLFQRSERVIPGGVNSPVRAFRAVGGGPRFISSASGAYISDVDGNRYIDYVGSWGPMILGHARKEVIAAIQEAASRGTSYGAPTELEVELAEEIAAAYPSVERIRMVSSGTEATMSAIRLARAFTRRDRIVKFEGCYHGHTDSLLVKGGSGLATFGTPDSAGVPANVVHDTLVVPYNDIAAVKEIFAEVGSHIACVIVEPIAGNMGCVPPAPGFLQTLRDVTTKHGALLIFDEVISGFRAALGGAQQLFNIKPDITCLGKIIGGGLPVGAFGGRAEIMKMIAPLGPVYQAGTLSGNPIAMTAGLTTVRLLKQLNPYSALDRRGAALEKGLGEAAASASVPVTINRAGSLLTVFFKQGPITDWGSAKDSDTEAYGRFFRAMLDRGVYLAPSQFECAFLSTEHSDDVIGLTVDAAREGFQTSKQ
ncbi:MAG TPA: glutamate-1-semialdehyde 2,1-aminomutase [Blastocatellia bacterium]|nr:glutamate-1-semialdehyde 2,1-aminomutase [Blastocatellia bacterium]